MRLIAYLQEEKDKLESVEAGAQVNNTKFAFEYIGTFETSATQNPTSRGDSGKIRVNFGAGGNTTGNEFTIAADGTITTNTGGEQYQFELMFRVGRTGAAGVSILVGRFMYASDGIEANAIQVGPTSVFELDNANAIFPESVVRHVAPATGSKIWFDIARDEDGNNSGGLLTVQPTGTLSGWNASNSASLQIEKQLLL